MRIKRSRRIAVALLVEYLGLLIISYTFCSTYNFLIDLAGCSFLLPFSPSPSLSLLLFPLPYSINLTNLCHAQSEDFPNRSAWHKTSQSDGSNSLLPLGGRNSHCGFSMCLRVVFFPAHLLLPSLLVSDCLYLVFHVHVYKYKFQLEMNVVIVFSAHR